MPESCTYGSVRGARSNARPYRDRCLSRFDAGHPAQPSCPAKKDWAINPSVLCVLW